MSLVINTNVAALNAYNNLNMNQTNLDGAFAQLSSGLRINKAADDSSGLAISQGLTSQINGLTQANSNVQDGINVAQIADGSLGTVQNVLQRMRTLVVQAANTGTQDPTSLAAIQSEMTSLNGELDNISSQTTFGSTNLLDGTYKGVFQVGSNGGTSNTITLDLTSGGNGGFNGVSSTELGLGASSGASGSADPTSSGFAGVASGTLSTLNIVKYNSVTGYAPNDGASGATSYGSTQAEDDLAIIDKAISQVSNARSSIGAVQNEMTYTSSNLQTAITNITASRSNLTDADLATQVTAMTQDQILTSAATSVLAQANSAPQAILKLLQ
jgi:flagellin